MRIKKENPVFCQTDSITVDQNVYPIANLTFEQVRLRYGTGRSYLISGSGRDKVTGYRSGVMTQIGDIEVSEWDALIKCLIEREGEQELFDNLLAWHTEFNYCESDKKTLLHDSLVSYAYRIFDNQEWVDYVRFNQRYRPEVLKTAKLVDIVTDCCGCSDVQTEALVDGWLQKVTCPRCGTYTTYKKERKVDV